MLCRKAEGLSVGESYGTKQAKLGDGSAKLPVGFVSPVTGLSDGRRLGSPHESNVIY
jgi:hypothetical protein